VSSIEKNEAKAQSQWHRHTQDDEETVCYVSSSESMVYLIVPERYMTDSLLLLTVIGSLGLYC